MDIISIISNHDEFKECGLTNRFFKHSNVMYLLDQLPHTFEVTTLGKSVKDKAITMVKWGKGDIKVMLWSQMHGDEATGTMALFDLFNFLQSDHPLATLCHETCQFYIIPMVNPDGAEAFTRRNAQQIDINRDFLANATPEAKILREARAQINPHFGFNLHDQLTLWSVTNTLKPATLSFLAPAIDHQLTIDETRKNAMLVIADIFKNLDELLPEYIGLFDDEFEPRAFGDNFQKAGTSTILIEAGGYAADFEKQQIRKYYFASILFGLKAIATKSFAQQKLENYFAIPKNNKQLFHILIHHIKLNDAVVSIGINYEECPTADGMSTTKSYFIEDIGDLRFYSAYRIFDKVNYHIEGTINIFKLANFNLLEGKDIVLLFQNGTLIEV